MAALAHDDVAIDARAMTSAWSRGDWGLLATRRPRAVLVALEDATPPGHDLVHGSGSHARAMHTLRDATEAGIAAVVTTTLTRSSARSAATIAGELRRLRIRAWCLSLAVATDAAAAAARLPSLGVTMPHVLRGAELASRAGVHVFLDGVPLCVLGPYARWALPDDGDAAAGLPCEACSARARCPGLAPIHRQRFGARELRALEEAPIEERSPGRDPFRHALRAMTRTSPARTSAD